MGRGSADADTSHRHFVKEELPQIRWTNPLLDIAVLARPQGAQDARRRLGTQATVEFRESESLLFVFRYQRCFLFFLCSVAVRVGRKGRDDVDDRHVQQVVDDQGTQGPRRAVNHGKRTNVPRLPLAILSYPERRQNESLTQSQHSKNPHLQRTGGTGSRHVQRTESTHPSLMSSQAPSPKPQPHYHTNKRKRRMQLVTPAHECLAYRVT